MPSIELEPGGSRIPVPRLADAAGVDQPLALRDLQILAGPPGLPGSRRAFAARERKRHVRMPDQADPVLLDVEAELGLQGGEHVLPHRVAGARVVEARLLFETGRLEVLEVRAGLRRRSSAASTGRRPPPRARTPPAAGRRGRPGRGSRPGRSRHGCERARRTRRGRRRSPRGLPGTTSPRTRTPRSRRAPPRTPGGCHGCPRRPQPARVLQSLPCAIPCVVTYWEHWPSSPARPSSRCVCCARVRCRDVRPPWTSVPTSRRRRLERGARFARPQLGLAAAGGALQLAAVAGVAVRPPRALRVLRSRAFAGGAAAGAGMALLTTVGTLPISALARRRALAAGLATQ